MQKAEGPYPRQSSAERKEALYHDIIEYFDKGKVVVFRVVLFFFKFSMEISGCSCGSVVLNSARR